LLAQGVAVWQGPRPTSPFQYEVGVANLGLWLASLYAAFKGFETRVAVAIAAACFLVGAGIGHIRDIVETGNLAPGNAGPIMVTDFLTPLVIVVLLFFASEKGGRSRRQRLRSRLSWKSRAKRCGTTAMP
jgi:hypothetical protein